MQGLRNRGNRGRSIDQSAKRMTVGYMVGDMVWAGTIDRHRRTSNSFPDSPPKPLSP